MTKINQFKLGENVKIIGGKFEGQKGKVVNIKTQTETIRAKLFFTIISEDEYLHYYYIIKLNSSDKDLDKREVLVEEEYLDGGLCIDCRKTEKTGKNILKNWR